jgi:uncharacterized protein
MHENKLGDPLALGLAAFIVAQTMLNMPNAHIVPPQATLFFLPVVLVCGGLVYFLATVFSYARGDTFGMAVNGFYGAFFTSLFLFIYFEGTGVLKFGTAASTALGSFLMVWTIITIPFTVGAFRINKMFGALFIFVLLAFLGGSLSNLVGLNTAYGGWAALISSAIGMVLLTQSLLASTKTNTDTERTSLQNGEIQAATGK